MLTSILIQWFFFFNTQKSSVYEFQYTEFGHMAFIIFWDDMCKDIVIFWGSQWHLRNSRWIFILERTFHFQLTYHRPDPVFGGLSQSTGIANLPSLSASAGRTQAHEIWVVPAPCQHFNRSQNSRWGRNFELQNLYWTARAPEKIPLQMLDNPAWQLSYSW